MDSRHPRRRRAPPGGPAPLLPSKADPPTHPSETPFARRHAGSQPRSRARRGTVTQERAGAPARAGARLPGVHAGPVDGAEVGEDLLAHARDQRLLQVEALPARLVGGCCGAGGGGWRRCVGQGERLKGRGDVLRGGGGGGGACANLANELPQGHVPLGCWWLKDVVSSVLLFVPVPACMFFQTAVRRRNGLGRAPEEA